MATATAMRKGTKEQLPRQMSSDLQTPSVQSEKKVPLKKEAPPVQRPEVHNRIEGLACCCTDMEGLLEEYTSGVEALLRAPTQEARVFVEEDGELPINQRSIQSLASRWREDRQAVKNVSDRYRTELAKEHERWMNNEAELRNSNDIVRQQEILAVIRRYRSPGLNLETIIQERADQHYEALVSNMPDLSQQDDENLATAKDAIAGWTEEVCKAVVLDHRQHWRAGQKQVLQGIAKELRGEHKLAAELLERHVDSAGAASAAVRKSWGREIKRAMDELDMIAGSYRAALQNMMEAKLRETKRHATEQAEFFQRELQEAIKTEQDEELLHGAQLRRMRLAILKWRHDYLRDAKIKAREAVERRKKSEKEDGADPASTGDGEDGDDDGEDVSSRPSVTKRAIARPETKAEQQLHKCQKVLGAIWSKLPAEEDAARNFLERVEAALPFTEEVLSIYEDHMQEHGLLAPLHASELPGSMSADPGGDDDSDNKGFDGASVHSQSRVASEASFMQKASAHSNSPAAALMQNVG